MKLLKIIPSYAASMYLGTVLVFLMAVPIRLLPQEGFTSAAPEILIRELPAQLHSIFIMSPIMSLIIALPAFFPAFLGVLWLRNRFTSENYLASAFFGALLPYLGAMPWLLFDRSMFTDIRDWEWPILFFLIPVIAGATCGVVFRLLCPEVGLPKFGSKTSGTPETSECSG